VAGIAVGQIGTLLLHVHWLLPPTHWQVTSPYVQPFASPIVPAYARQVWPDAGRLAGHEHLRPSLIVPHTQF